ncbi:uncharacterized protein LOC126897226 [Daktulosphaira vitifoliae]|uniref:uncharacterized protein LOC126897226 n=1 Tax=Daktulosphaira vitifoliae TaxID=58002 RepID=UPI0021A99671|nr:uncharacterized protein LOC126897226 [Daktulosphaira vitifoliae]
MAEERKRRRSSFFPKLVEELNEDQLELFRNVSWVEEEKENIISNSKLFGGSYRETISEFTDNFKLKKNELPKLIASKHEERICLKEKLHNTKKEIDWETANNELTSFERDFFIDCPDYKFLVKKVHTLTLYTTLMKRSNFELHSILKSYNERANKEIQKIQANFIQKIIEDSGVGISFDKNDSCSTTSDESEF